LPSRRSAFNSAALCNPYTMTKGGGRGRRPVRRDCRPAGQWRRRGDDMPVVDHGSLRL